MRNALTDAAGIGGPHVLTEMHSGDLKVIALVRDEADVARVADSRSFPVIVDLCDVPAVVAAVNDNSGATHTTTPGPDPSVNCDLVTIDAAIGALGSNGKPGAHISGGWTASDGPGWDTSARPVLEIWIDELTSPATIRLEGVLDRTTEGPFLRFIDQLLLDGVRHLMIDAGAVEVGDVTGGSALTRLRRRICELGGSLTGRESMSGNRATECHHHR